MFKCNYDFYDDVTFVTTDFKKSIIILIAAEIIIILSCRAKIYFKFNICWYKIVKSS